MTTRRLTPAQHAFALAVASGKSQAAAYRIAYPKSADWKDDSVHNKASALMRKAQVAARVGEHRAELAEKALWTREASVRTLMQVIATADKPSDVVSAVKALNEMHGFNAPQKVEHSGGGVMVNLVIAGVDPPERR